MVGSELREGCCSVAQSCPTLCNSMRAFLTELALCIRWPKDWSFSFTISPSIEYSGMISFRIDWFDLLALQGTSRSLLQHHNLKASVLPYSAFFMVQLSHPYMTTGKTIALTVWAMITHLIKFGYLGIYSWTQEFQLSLQPLSKLEIEQRCALQIHCLIARLIIFPMPGT